jgi:hypothetical protein
MHDLCGLCPQDDFEDAHENTLGCARFADASEPFTCQSDMAEIIGHDL